jgi:hypothetical protein
MFRLRLHPTSSGLFFGIAVIAFWGLLWLWFLGQLPQQPGSAPRHSNVPIEVAASVRDGGGLHAGEASLPATAF